MTPSTRSAAHSFPPPPRSTQFITRSEIIRVHLGEKDCQAAVGAVTPQALARRPPPWYRAGMISLNDLVKRLNARQPASAIGAFNINDMTDMHGVMNAAIHTGKPCIMMPAPPP